MPPPRVILAHGAGTTGRDSQSSICHVKSSISTGVERAPRRHCHTNMKVYQGSKGLLAMLCYCLSMLTCQELHQIAVGNRVVDHTHHARFGRASVPLPAPLFAAAAASTLQQHAALPNTCTNISLGQDAWLQDSSKNIVITKSFEMTLFLIKYQENLSKLPLRVSMRP